MRIIRNPESMQPCVLVLGMFDGVHRGHQALLMAGEALAPVREEVVGRILELTHADTLTVHDHMSIIATVGRGMVHNCGTAARLFSAMSRARINVRMIDQGSSELSIIVGVDDQDFEKTIQAIYSAFVN